MEPESSPPSTALRARRAGKRSLHSRPAANQVALLSTRSHQSLFPNYTAVPVKEGSRVHKEPVKKVVGFDYRSDRQSRDRFNSPIRLRQVWRNTCVPGWNQHGWWIAPAMSGGGFLVPGAFLPATVMGQCFVIIAKSFASCSAFTS